MQKFTLSFLIITTAFFSCNSNESATADSSAQMDSSIVIVQDTIQKNLVTDVTILYGTDRVLLNNNNGNDEIKYGNLPANPGSPSYNVGYTIVTIPPTHEEGNIETPSIWKLEFHEDSLKHMIQKKIRRLSDKDFNSLLKKARNGQDAFVFIHGYNNSFKDAALRTAQLAQDIHLPITPIMFSWSSNGRAANYAGDEEKVQLAVPAFEDFLKRLANASNYNKIHLIAHSMGNRLISLALLQLRNDPINLKIDQIIMAAPDVYADLFKLNYAEAIIQRSKHVTVYTAKNDWALLASRKLHGNVRLGEIGTPPPVYAFNNIDIIDAVNEKTDFLGHDRFARSSVIITDMDSILKSGRTAAQRNIPHKNFDKYLYYYFK